MIFGAIKGRKGTAILPAFADEQSHAQAYELALLRHKTLCCFLEGTGSSAIQEPCVLWY